MTNQLVGKVPAGMPAMPVYAQLEGEPERWDFVADNREHVAWELYRVEHPGTPTFEDAPILWANRAAWHAARREGRFPGSWETWCDRCADAGLLTDPDPDGDPAGSGDLQTVGPSLEEPTPASPSSSP